MIAGAATAMQEVILTHISESGILDCPRCHVGFEVDGLRAGPSSGAFYTLQCPNCHRVKFTVTEEEVTEEEVNFGEGRTGKYFVESLRMMGFEQVDAIAAVKACKPGIGLQEMANWILDRGAEGDTTQGTKMSGGSRFAACPLCQKKFHHLFLATHCSTCGENTREDESEDEGDRV